MQSVRNRVNFTHAIALINQQKFYRHPHQLSSSSASTIRKRALCRVERFPRLRSDCEPILPFCTRANVFFMLYLCFVRTGTDSSWKHFSKPVISGHSRQMQKQKIHLDQFLIVLVAHEFNIRNTRGSFRKQKSPPPSAYSLSLQPHPLRFPPIAGEIISFFRRYLLPPLCARIPCL